MEMRSTHPIDAEPRAIRYRAGLVGQGARGIGETAGARPATRLAGSQVAVRQGGDRYDPPEPPAFRGIEANADDSVGACSR